MAGVGGVAIASKATLKTAVAVGATSSMAGDATTQFVGTGAINPLQTIKAGIAGAVTAGAFYGGAKAIGSVKSANNPKIKGPDGGGSQTPKTFVDMMEPDEAVRYQRYWEQDYKPVFKGEPNTRQRLYTVPGERSIKDIKINNKTGETYVRETIFDKFGRRIGNNDFTNHGRPDVSSHTNPHHHKNPWYNPNQHGPGTAGLHPETPRR